MEAVTGKTLLAEVSRALADAPSIVTKRILDDWCEEQGLGWSYRQARIWLADCLNPDRPHRLPVELLPIIRRHVGHLRFLHPLLALDSMLTREAEVEAEVERRMTMRTVRPSVRAREIA